MNVNYLLRRYGAAFAEYARESIGIINGIEELMVFKKALSDNPDFYEFLIDPEISQTEKCGFIEILRSAGFSEEFGHFIKLLIIKNRINIIREIADYVYNTYAHEGEVNAVIKTAHPMGTEIMNSLRRIAEKRSGRKFNITEEIDGSLLGGMRIEIGSILIDASIKRELNELGEILKKTGVAQYADKG